jgi:hypothetical protein
MFDESDDKNLGIENKIAWRNFIKFLGAPGVAGTLPSRGPLSSAFGGNATTISSNSNKILVTSYQANLIVLK